MPEYLEVDDQTAEWADGLICDGYDCEYNDCGSCDLEFVYCPYGREFRRPLVIE